MKTPLRATQLAMALALAATLAWPLVSVRAQTAGTAIHIFGSSKCHLCEESATYLRAVAERENARVLWHDSDESPREAKLMRAVAKELQMSVDGYPFIVVGRRGHLGWKGATTGLIITNELQQVRAAGDEDVVARLEAALDDQTRASADRRRGVDMNTPRLAIIAILLAVIAGALFMRRRRS